MPPHPYVTSVNIKKLSRLGGYIACEDAAGGGSFIPFLTAAGIIKFIILMVDCNQERIMCL